MKSNNSDSYRVKKTISIFILIASFGIVFSMITVPTIGATITPVQLGAIMLGGLIGNFLYDLFTGDNQPDNPSLANSQANLLLAWEGSAERINNQFKQSDVDVMNFVNLFNVSYLYWIRQAEHEVASVISITNWHDAKDNMTSFDLFEDALKSFMLSQLSKYSAIDIYALRDMYDTDAKDDISVLSDNGVAMNPDTFLYGLQPFVGDRNTEWYLVDVYVPTGESLKIDGDSYAEGIYQFGGERHNLTEVSSDSILITGFPTNYDLFTRKWYNVTDELIESSHDLNTNIYINRHVDNLTATAGNSFVQDIGYKDDGGWHRFSDGTHTYSISGKLIEIGVFGTLSIPLPTVGSIKCSYKIHDIFYRPDALRLWIETSLAGNMDIKQYITDSDNINFYGVILPFLSTIEQGMDLQAHILFNYYHNHGWYSTDDIPSQYLVIMPDLNFDNLQALAGLNITEAQFIYYSMLKQLDNETLWVQNNIDSKNISITDFGKWMVKAKLVHGGNTIFDHTWVWVVPQTGDLYLVNNSNNILNQSVLIFNPDDGTIYMGYSGDTLHVYALLEDGEYQDNMTVERQTLHDFLIAQYGFDVSVFGEWVFPSGTTEMIYNSLAIAGIISGIVVWGLGHSKNSEGKKRGYLKILGILMIIAGGLYLLYAYIIYPFAHFFGWL